MTSSPNPNSNSNSITYESVLSFLNVAQKEIVSSLDVKRSTDPFNEKDNEYSTIDDIKIYCDSLSYYMNEVALDHSQRDSNYHHHHLIDNENLLGVDNNCKSTCDQIDGVNEVDESNDRSSSTCLTHTSSSQNSSREMISNSDSPLISPILVKSFTSPLSLSQPTICSSLSSDLQSSDEKPVDEIKSDQINNLLNQRLSYYENNDEINIELLTAYQIKTIIESSDYKNFKYEEVSISKSSSFSSKTKSTQSLTSHKNPLFGCHIEMIQPTNYGFALPPSIERILIYLANKGLKTEGIFRKSGVKSRIVQLKQALEDRDEIDYEEYCIYDIADVTKTWFRELKPTQLITQQIVNLFKTKKKKEFTLWFLPDHHRSLLQVVLRFLSFFASQSSFNQMNSHNLSICLTPSICHFDGDQQLFDAQKCLEYCIDNCEMLFIVSLNSYLFTKGTGSESSFPMKHESTALIQAKPNQIMKRILYQRNLIDPLIVEWNVEEESENSDTYAMKIQLSAFLPMKTVVIDRKWRSFDGNNIEIIENGHLHESRWSLISQGEGKTLVAHMIAFDLRGHSYTWYTKTFPSIHNMQLDSLAQSFIIPDYNSVRTTFV